MYPLTTQLTGPRPTFMKWLHRNRKVVSARLTPKPLTTFRYARRGSSNSTTVRPRPFMYVAGVSVHNQLTQWAVVRRRVVEFTLRFDEVAAAGETEEGIRASWREGWRRCIVCSWGGLFQLVSDAGEMAGFGVGVDDGVADFTVPRGGGM